MWFNGGMTYHLAFTWFHPRTIDATERLFHSRPWVDTRRTRQEKYERWLQRTSAVYGVEAPFLAIVPSENYDGAYWRRTILLPRYSVMTLLHEFRHHLQQHGDIGPFAGVEDDARAWSMSLFYRVRPELFRQGVATGAILHAQGVSV